MVGAAMKVGDEVYLATSYLLQAPGVRGFVLDIGPNGVMLREKDGSVRFYPWSSVGCVTLNPKAADEEPF